MRCGDGDVLEASARFLDLDLSQRFLALLRSLLGAGPIEFKGSNGRIEPKVSIKIGVGIGVRASTFPFVKNQSEPWM